MGLEMLSNAPYSKYFRSGTARMIIKMLDSLDQSTDQKRPNESAEHDRPCDDQKDGTVGLVAVNSVAFCNRRNKEADLATGDHSTSKYTSGIE